MTLKIYSIIAMSAAGILPPLAAGYMVWYCKRTIRRMDMRLAEMRELHAGMCELVAAPKRIRQMAQEMRDTVTRIQETP